MKITDEEMAFRRCIINQRNKELTAAIHWHLIATSLTVLSGNRAAIFMYFMIPGSFAYLKISLAGAPKWYTIRNELMGKSFKYKIDKKKCEKQHLTQFEEKNNNIYNIKWTLLDTYRNVFS